MYPQLRESFGEQTHFDDHVCGVLEVDRHGLVRFQGDAVPVGFDLPLPVLLVVVVYLVADHRRNRFALKPRSGRSIMLRSSMTGLACAPERRNELAALLDDGERLKAEYPKVAECLDTAPMLAGPRIRGLMRRSICGSCITWPVASRCRGIRTGMWSGLRSVWMVTAGL